MAVESQRMFRSEKFTIPFTALDSQVIEVKRFPIVWCIGSAVVSGLFPIIITALFSAKGDERIGLVVFSVMDLAVAVCSWIAFAERRIDAFVIPFKNRVRASLIVRRSSPSAAEVRRFIDALGDRIDEAKIRYQA